MIQTENDTLIQTEIYPIPKSKDRLKIPVSTVIGSRNNKIIEYLSLKDILNRIVDTNNNKLVELTKTIAESRTNKSAYDKIKNNKCNGFIVGRFGPTRQDGNCEIYVPLLGFDIDSIEDEECTALTLSECKQIPEIFLAFPSPSGKGLRIFIWCESSPETHKKVYELGCKMLSESLRIETDKAVRIILKDSGVTDTKEINKILKETEHIDTSTKNISRLWFYTHLPKSAIYLNENSTIFRPILLKTSNKTKRPLNTIQPIRAISQAERIEICVKMANERYNVGGRNNNLYFLACLMVEHGVNEAEILSHCISLREKDFRVAEITKAVNSAIKRARANKFTDSQILAYISKRKGNKVPPATIKQAEAKASKSANKNTKQNNEPNPNVKKSKFVQIKQHLSSKYEFRLNTIACEIEYKKQSEKDKEPYELNENDLICELLEMGWTGVETPLIALLKSSFTPKYNPFNDYFENLPIWNESKPDYISQLANYVDAADQKWFNYQFKKMLVRSIACAIGKIPFNKQCFTLQGKQNDGKTSFLRFLCPPKLKNYYNENLDINNKDGRLSVCQNLFINFDELSKFSKYDINKMKAFFTIESVKDRLPYDRKPSNFKRTVSFLGSTNNSEFLSDETGNVRWLIFKVNSIKHDKGGKNGYNKNVDIDLVYSQAYSLLKSGYDFQLSKEDIATSEKINKQYMIRTAEQEMIEEFFEPSTKDDFDAEFCTATKIMELMRMVTKTTLYKNNIGKALQFLGFRQVSNYDTNSKFTRKGYWVKKTVTLKGLLDDYNVKIVS